MPHDALKAGGWKRGTPQTWLTKAERAEVTRLSLARGMGLLILYFGLYYATMVGAVASLPVYASFIFAVLNGVMIGMIFIIGHDCAHRAYVPGRRLNWWLGRLTFIPCAHSISLWDVVHNRTHHARTNLKGVDYVWAPMSKAEYDACSPWRRFMERIYRGPFGPVVYYYPKFWLSKLVLPLAADSRPEWRRHLPDSVFVLLALVATIALVIGLGHWLAPERPMWLTLTLGWGIPFAVWNYMMAFSIYIQHTHPRVPWFDNEAEWSFYNGNIRGTTHVDFPKFAALLRDVHAHPAHHALPSIPVYHLPEAEEKLLDSFGDDVVRYRLTPSAYLSVCRKCKLYDFRNHVWTDFDGIPTSERTLPVISDKPAPSDRAASSTPKRRKLLESV